VKPAALLIELD